MQIISKILAFSLSLNCFSLFAQKTGKEVEFLFNGQEEKMQESFEKKLLEESKGQIEIIDWKLKEESTLVYQFQNLNIQKGILKIILKQPPLKVILTTIGYSEQKDFDDFFTKKNVGLKERIEKKILELISENMKEIDTLSENYQEIDQKSLNQILDDYFIKNADSDEVKLMNEFLKSKSSYPIQIKKLAFSRVKNIYFGLRDKVSGKTITNIRIVNEDGLVPDNSPLLAENIQKELITSPYDQNDNTEKKMTQALYNSIGSNDEISFTNQTGIHEHIGIYKPPYNDNPPILPSPDENNNFRYKVLDQNEAIKMMDNAIITLDKLLEKITPNQSYHAYLVKRYQQSSDRVGAAKQMTDEELKTIRSKFTEVKNKLQKGLSNPFELHNDLTILRNYGGKTSSLSFMNIFDYGTIEIRIYDGSTRNMKYINRFSEEITKSIQAGKFIPMNPIRRLGLFFSACFNT